MLINHVNLLLKFDCEKQHWKGGHGGWEFHAKRLNFIICGRNVRCPHNFCHDCSPGYKGQDICLQSDYKSDNEEYLSGSSNDEGTSDNQVTVIVGTVTSQQALDSVDSYPNRLFTPVQINEERTVNMKINTGADTPPPPHVQNPCISSHYTNRNWRKCLLMMSLRKSLNRPTGLTQ